MRIQHKTKDSIEKMQSRLRLKDMKLTQQNLIDDAIEYAVQHEDDFIAFISKADTPLEDDPLWQLIHNPVDMGETDAKNVDEYLYGGD